jgi:hypothetical protein
MGRSGSSGRRLALAVLGAATLVLALGASEARPTTRATVTLNLLA